MKIYRHGDLGLTPIKKLPKDLLKADTNVIMTGSGGNDHIIKNGQLYFKKVDDFVFGYLVAKKGAKLYHKEHGDRQVNGLMEADLTAGVYELRKQQEITNEGMKPVVD